ncbi:MAG: VOC family protein [Polyangia bacterium]
MAKRTSIVHLEWRSRNVAKLKEFYRAAFSWKFDESMPGYLLADSGSKELAIGMVQLDNGSPMQPGIVPFLESHDLAASETAIKEAGGQIIGEPQEVPGWGRFSLFTDPDGTPVGLWQSHDAVKKEEKRAKKAEKKRARVAEEAAPPSTEPARPAKESDADKAARKAAKAEKKTHKAEKKAQKRKKQKDEPKP